MNDEYKNVKSQIGAQGAQSVAHDNQFFQDFRTWGESVDFAELASQLNELRQALKKEAQDDEHDIAIGKVAEAEQAAKAGDDSKVAEYLRATGAMGVGKWPSKNWRSGCWGCAKESYGTTIQLAQTRRFLYAMLPRTVAVLCLWNELVDKGFGDWEQVNREGPFFEYQGRKEKAVFHETIWQAALFSVRVSPLRRSV